MIQGLNSDIHYRNRSGIHCEKTIEEMCLKFGVKQLDSH